MPACENHSSLFLGIFPKSYFIFYCSAIPKIEIDHPAQKINSLSFMIQLSIFDLKPFASIISNIVKSLMWICTTLLDLPDKPLEFH